MRGLKKIDSWWNPDFGVGSTHIAFSFRLVNIGLERNAMILLSPTLILNNTFIIEWITQMIGSSLGYVDRG